MCSLLVFQGALSGLISSTVVIFSIVTGAYVYHAPLPELPFDTSGCEEQVAAIFNTYHENVIDLMNLPTSTTEEYVEVAASNNWYVYIVNIIVLMI